MEKNKITSKEFKELMKTPKGKAMAFFGGYLLFFMIIALFARVGGTTLDKTYESGNPLTFSLANVLNENFDFNYEIMVDGESKIYTGKSTQKAKLFTMNNVNNYYYNGSNYFEDNDGIWVNVNNPISNSGFTDVNKLKTIIEKATYISKTEYDSGKDVYNFNVFSSTINKILENNDIDIEEIPNEIMISVNDENVVNEIKFNLDSYCKVKNLCMRSMQITLQFDNFGKVSEINSPLE